jgi:vacuolar iron transporter family protein
MNNPTEKEEDPPDKVDRSSGIFIGLSDGLIIPFALSMGLSVLLFSSQLIFLIGLLFLMIVGVMMGWSGYFAGKAVYDHYYDLANQEYEKYSKSDMAEKKNVPPVKKFKNSPSALIEREKENWIAGLLNKKYGLAEPDQKKRKQTSYLIGVAYILGGLIPLIPYQLVESTIQASTLSVGLTLPCLFIAGAIKSKIQKRPPLSGAVKTVLTGALAGGATYYVALIFKQVSS